MLAALALVCGIWSVAFSFAQAIGKERPDVAHRLAPWDGRLTALAATAMVGPEAGAADRRRADALAREALMRDATAVNAASTLGVNADMRGDPVRSRQAFLYALTLTRRDAATALWVIEDAVKRGDVPAALRGYDVALRVKPVLSDLLYPVLTAASTDPVIRAALIRTLAARPMWTESFVSYAASNSPDWNATSSLLLGLQRAGVTVPAGAQASVVNGLIAQGRMGRAWEYYASIRSGVRRDRSRDPGFDAGGTTPSQFDWEPINEGVTTAIANGAFDFAAPPSVGGPLLQQMQLLPPGRYRLLGRSQGIEQEAASRPYWTLRCADRRELGRIDIPNSQSDGGRFAGTFVVPANCPVQLLLLVARPTDTVAGLSGQVDRTQLLPLR